MAAASRRQLILVGHEKLVPVLGSRGRLPVEVAPIACHRDAISRPHGPRVRGPDNRRPVVVTDNGNVIVDCAVSRIEHAADLHARLRAIPGVVDTGLFLGTAEMVLVSDGPVIRELARSR
jgi:ribose 5-phosphate isomerase A